MVLFSHCLQVPVERRKKKICTHVREHILYLFSHCIQVPVESVYRIFSLCTEYVLCAYRICSLRVYRIWYLCVLNMFSTCVQNMFSICVQHIFSVCTEHVLCRYNASRTCGTLFALPAVSSKVCVHTHTYIHTSMVLVYVYICLSIHIYIVNSTTRGRLHTCGGRTTCCAWRADPNTPTLRLCT